jgi:hypothetical protein
MPAAELPPGTMLNTNGAGDSFTSGLLVATMLRHTGITVASVRSPNGNKSDDMKNGESEKASEVSFARSTASSTKKLTPYTLYMRENYVSLKRQCKDDKKAIFTKCHEMWENETPDVKSMYGRMAKEENEEAGINTSMTSMDDVESLDTSNLSHGTTSSGYDNNNLSQTGNSMTNKSLNLESAVQFAGLVAAHHVDVSTRDLAHLDVSSLLERAMMFPTGLQEI